MSNLYSIIDRVGRLKDELPSLAISVITDDDIDIMQDRLEQGLYADGSEFPEYSPLTLTLKRLEGGFISQSGRIALKNSGAYYQSMILRKEKDYAEIVADDVHNLSVRYGDEILDVSQDESNEIFERKREPFINAVENFIFK